MSGPSSTMKDARRTAAQDKFGVVSLFANTGGMDLGAMRAGGRVLLANEISPVAQRIYRLNFPDTVLDTSDVKMISASYKATAAFLARAGLKPGQVDCVAGGSPCNRLSTLAKANLLGDSVLDTRRLLFDFVRVILHAAPLTALMENVAALVERHPLLLKVVLKLLRFGEDGKRRYFVWCKVLCASHYGVPQIRRRVFIIAIRADVAERIGITSDEAVDAVFPDPTTPTPHTVRWALQGLRITDAHLQPFRVAMAGDNTAGKLTRRLPLDPDTITRPHHVGFSRKSYFNMERCALDKPAPPLTARGLLPISLGGHLHPTQNRKFCIPEILRLFGMPDDFDFGWSTAHEAAGRLGLMVPPPMAEALFRAIFERVLRPYRQIMDAPTGAMIT